jgi:chromate transport protein ChrA
MEARVRRAQVLLIVVAVVFIPVFAVPLFIDPYWWGDVFGWDTRQHSDLTAYLGRCLGAVALAISVAALMAARDPAGSRALFDVLGLAAALLVLVHVRGLAEESQPLVEHLEIAMYAGFAALAWWCKPPLPSVGEP